MFVAMLVLLEKEVLLFVGVSIEVDGESILEALGVFGVVVVGVGVFESVSRSMQLTFKKLRSTTKSTD